MNGAAADPNPGPNPKPIVVLVQCPACTCWGYDWYIVKTHERGWCAWCVAKFKASKPMYSNPVT